ncbi:MAG: hypothetical protein HYT73_04605 [Candidatus Aenigmarchaeota archaeon]|nr:hypothetical protein [Candidatus Aenigmarchaeota archaeon]
MAAIQDRLADELFLERRPDMPTPEFRKYLSHASYMPGIAPDSSVPGDLVHQIRQAHEEVRMEPRVGITEERHYGRIPVQIDRNPPYLGVTEFKPTYENGRPRITATNYMDVGHHTRTLIMESYAEFGGMQAAPHERDEILTTTPYTPAIKFGMYVDRFYRSEDGARGYAAFIRDIQRNRSARRTLQHLGSNIKEAMARGEDPIRATEKTYEREAAAVRKAA